MTSRRKNEASTRPTNKRLRDPEEELLRPAENAPPAKRAKTTVSDESQRLTADSLKQHTFREGYLELMNSEADKGPRSRGSKRSASRVGIGDGSIASTSRDQETTSQVTQKSSFTAAHYRNSILKGANIRFQFGLLPEDIRTQATAIVQMVVSPERKEELSLIGQKLYDKFVDVLDTAAKEDDCVELFYQALSSIGYNESLTLPRKADWQPSLKPRIRPTTSKLDHLYRTEDEAGESFERPGKRHRHQGADPYLSPDTGSPSLV